MITSGKWLGLAGALVLLIAVANPAADLAFTFVAVGDPLPDAELAGPRRDVASYLGTEAVMDADGLRVPALLLWYMGDFGGPRGLRGLLRDAGVEGWRGPIRFSAYDWTPIPGRWLAGHD